MDDQGRNWADSSLTIAWTTRRAGVDALRKHVFETVTPARVVALTKLGDTREFVACDDLVMWFFSYFAFPKIHDERALKNAVARGTAEVFGYLSAARVEDGTVVPSRREMVWFGSPIPEDEVDLGPGCFILTPRLAQTLRGEPAKEDEVEHFEEAGVDVDRALE